MPDPSVPTEWGDTKGIPPTLEAFRRQRRHKRDNSLAHHKSQTHEVHGGRTAAAHQAKTDEPRFQGQAPKGRIAQARTARRIEPQAPDPFLTDRHGNVRSPAAALRADPRQGGRPLTDPDIKSELESDFWRRMMQPGEHPGSEAIDKLTGGVVPGDDDDDYID